MRTVIGLAAVLMLGGAPPGGPASVGERMFDRLKTLTGDSEGTIAEFALVDVTNVGPKNAGHVQGFFIQLVDADHLTLRFTFGGGPGRGVENIVVKRVRRS